MKNQQHLKNAALTTDITIQTNEESQ